MPIYTTTFSQDFWEHYFQQEEEAWPPALESTTFTFAYLAFSYYQP